ncbi:zinc finger BED domain-containing protein RICESLEEPER 1-like [Oryza sativa Japonica Group]|uniref:zinc finger BED domain-containing protein RICESLEEPER 1-like n=2 Tax=Oryza sativa subsp. japonica TaxID=39947 RepID=UPI00339D2522
MDDPNYPIFDMSEYDPNFGMEQGGSIPAPMPEEPATTQVASEGSGTVAASGSTASSSKRSRTSTVWQNFDEIKETGPDGKEVTLARCKICRTKLSGKSSSGTGHLSRHAASCAKKQGIQLRQQQLILNPDGTVRSWEYDPQVARESLTRLIARQDLPLNFGESTAFEKYIQTAHNPRFKSVSSQTTTRDLRKFYKQGRDTLKELFNTCTFSVSITSDIWSGKAKEDYISVVAHFVDDNWEIQKRIIALKLIDVAHTADNIAERISMVVQEFDLTNKIFAITLDNAAANSRAMEILQPVFSVYGQSFLLHQRCACHIINLIVKTGFKRVSTHIDSVREAISWLFASNPRVAKWKRFCDASGMKPRKFRTDTDHRWNTTYLMLRHVLPYKDLLTVFLQSNNATNSDGQLIMSEPTWYVVEKFAAFLEIFHDATVALSGVYYPTANLMLHKILEIATLLQENENDHLLSAAVFHMKQKYLKYWKEIPVLYAFAFILDPRGKLRGLVNMLNIIGEIMNIDYTNYYSDVKTKLYETFAKYENKFQGLRLQRPPTVSVAGKKKIQWGRIWGGSSSSTPAGSSASGTTGTFQGTQELSSYLDSDCTSTEDLNVLGWWNDHKTQYPVLSKLARDVFTVPVSTVSSESAFSTCGRIIEDRRRNLSSDMVEMLLIVKDWELAAERAQHSAENLELVAQFEDLYIDTDAQD